MDPMIHIIPGFYADEQGRLYLNIREFMSAHGMPDTPELRAIIWDEIREMFEVEVIEITD